MAYNWKILIAISGTILDDFYKNDPMFNNDNWIFFNVSNKKITHNKFNIINSCDIPGYTYLGKDWAESEVIYNVFKLDLFRDQDFLGIIHWDFNLYSKLYDTYKITLNIANIIAHKEWISFFPAKLSTITQYYSVLLDERKPNCLFTRNSMLNNPITAEIFSKCVIDTYDKNIKISTNENCPISLCCSFITKRNIFINLGKMISYCVENKIFEKFDIDHRHRLPGQVIERLVALYSTGFDKFDFLLDHKFIGGNELNKNDPNGENY